MCVGCGIGCVVVGCGICGCRSEGGCVGVRCGSDSVEVGYKMWVMGYIWA